MASMAEHVLLPSYGHRHGALIFLGLILLSSVYLICYVKGSSLHHLVYVRPYMALFIKQSGSLFRGILPNKEATNLRSPIAKMKRNLA
jgi:hypothetical protein